jgi:hypothetical protein
MKHTVLAAVLVTSLQLAPAPSYAMDGRNRDYMQCYKAIGITPKFGQSPMEITTSEQLDRLLNRHPEVLGLLSEHETVRAWTGTEIIEGQERRGVWWTERRIGSEVSSPTECQMAILEEDAQTVAVE